MFGDATAIDAERHLYIHLIYPFLTNINYLIFAHVLFVSRLMTPHFGNKPSTPVRFTPKPFHFASAVSQPPLEKEQLPVS